MATSYRARKISANTWDCFEGDMTVPFLKVCDIGRGQWALQLQGWEADESRQFMHSVLAITRTQAHCPSLKVLLAAVRRVRDSMQEEAARECAADQATEMAVERWFEEHGGPTAEDMAAEDHEREWDATGPGQHWDANNNL